MGGWATSRTILGRQWLQTKGGQISRLPWTQGKGFCNAVVSSSHAAVSDGGLRSDLLPSNLSSHHLPLHCPLHASGDGLVTLLAQQQVLGTYLEDESPRISAHSSAKSHRLQNFKKKKKKA
ncbi:mCG140879, partial [Mus musculus]